MVRDDYPQDPNSTSSITDWPRRTVLKIGGAGAGLAALGGFSMLGAGQEDENGGQNGDDDGDDDDGDSASLVDDLIDPVFGYPLAADESDAVDLENGVELAIEEGGGAHANFPHDPEAGGEVPAEFFFDPVGLHVEPDTVVQFLVGNGEHTITAFHEKFGAGPQPVPTRIPEDVPGFTSPPLVPDESWLYQFSEKGVYDVFCFPHFGLGMAMRLVVMDPEEDDIEDEAFTEPTGGAVPPNVGAVLAADELDPANIVDASRIAWEDLTIDVQQTSTATPTES